MAANPQFHKLLRKFREVATRISHEDIRSRISAAITEHYEAAKGDEDYGPWCYVVAVLGDDKSGDVVYFADGDLMRASYTMRTTDSKATCAVDCENAVEVAVSTTYLPKEAARSEAADLEIVGDCIPLKEGAVGQDGSAYLKLIAPGRGSSGYYPAEVLERDGPKVFPAGTKNFWNHQTDAEEAARPEGDLRDLASVLSEDAHYEKAGPAGPGLYAKAKVFENFRQPVDDLAKHIGMSIRATGKAKEGKAPDGQTGPIIEQLTRGLSVDYVTTPGAGGKVLQLFEAARAAKPAQAEIPLQEAATDMDAAEFKKLQESNAAQALQIRKLTERQAIADAGAAIAQYFTTVRVGEAVQKRVTARILAAAVPLTEAGELDKVKLAALVEAETKDECAYLAEVAGRQIVAGMGSAPAQPTAAELAATETATREELDSNAGNYGVETKEGKKLLVMGRAAFDPSYNSRLKETA